MFYQSSDGGLRAIDPLNPSASPILVDADAAPPPTSVIAAAIPIELADYDAATATASNRRVERIFYNRSDGTLWQVEAARTGTDSQADAPAPARISAEFEAMQLCSALSASAYGEIDQVRILYLIPGPDQNCSDDDNLWRVVTPGMDASEPPLDFPGRVAAVLIDPASGALAGWLSQDVDALLHVRPDLTTVPLATISSFLTIFGQVRTGHVFLNLDGGLQILDLTGSGALVDTGYDFPGGLNLTAVVDGERLYFVAATADTSAALMTADVDGNVQILHEAPDAANVQVIAASWFIGDRVLYQYATGNNGFPNKVVSLTRSGTDPVTLLESNAADFAGGIAAIYDETHVFIRDGMGINPPDLQIAPADGSASPVRFEDAVQAEFSRPAMHPVFHFTPAESVFVLEGVGDLDAAGGATLLVLDPADPAMTQTLGQVPDEFEEFFPGRGLGRYHLAQAAKVVISGTSVNASSDVFFLDTQTPNSLLRITETPDVSEFPIR